MGAIPITLAMHQDQIAKGDRAGHGHGLRYQRHGRRDPRRSPPPAGLEWARSRVVQGKSRRFPWGGADLGTPRTPAPERGTLLCVHGIESSYLWRRLVATPPKGWRVVAVDQMDMGFSIPPARPQVGSARGRPRHRDRRAGGGSARWSPSRTTGRPDLAGMGTAAHRPTGGAVLSNTGVHQPKDRPGATVIRAARTPVSWLPSPGTPQPSLRWPVLLQSRCLRLRSVVATTRRTARPATSAIEQFVHVFLLEPGHPSAAALDAIAQGLGALKDIPVFLLWGPRDRARVSHLRDLISRMPHADVHRYQGSSHFVSEDAPTFAADAATGCRTSMGRRRSVTFPAGVPVDGIAQRRGDPAAAVIEMGSHPRTISFGDLHNRVENIAAGTGREWCQWGPGSRCSCSRGST